MRVSSHLEFERQSCHPILAPSGWQIHPQLQQAVQRHVQSRQKAAQLFLGSTRAVSKLEALQYAARQSSSSFTLQQTLQAVALPPDYVPALGPRVEHIIAKDAGTLSAILSSQLLLPEVGQSRQDISCSWYDVHTQHACPCSR